MRRIGTNLRSEDGFGIVGTLVSVLIIAVVVTVAGPQLKKAFDATRARAEEKRALTEATNNAINGTEAAAQKPPAWCWRCEKTVAGPDEAGRCPNCSANLANQLQLEKGGLTHAQWKKDQETARRQAEERQRQTEQEQRTRTSRQADPGRTTNHAPTDSTVTGGDDEHQHSGGCCGTGTDDSGTDTDSGHTEDSSSQSGDD